MRHLLLLPFAVICLAFPAAGADVTWKLDAVPYALQSANPAVKAEASGDSLVLTAPKGSDMFTPASGQPNHSAPRVTFSPQGDFILSARLEGPFGADYDGGALIIHGGHDYWAKLLFERINPDENVVTSSAALPMGDNSYHVRVPPDVTSVWLKIVRIERSILFYMSQDGKTWQILRDFSVDPARPLTAGFMSQAPLGDTYTVTFSHIRYEARTITDYWQGE